MSLRAFVKPEITKRSNCMFISQHRSLWPEHGTNGYKRIEHLRTVLSVSLRESTESSTVSFEEARKKSAIINHFFALLDWINQSSLNIFSDFHQNKTSQEGEKRKNNMTINQRGDIYICCECGNSNVVAHAPRCPVCGHENAGCCQQGGLNLSHDVSRTMSMSWLGHRHHHHHFASHDSSSSSRSAQYTVPFSRRHSGTAASAARSTTLPTAQRCASYAATCSAATARMLSVAT